MTDYVRLHCDARQERAIFDCTNGNGRTTRIDITSLASPAFTIPKILACDTCHARSVYSTRDLCDDCFVYDATVYMKEDLE